MIDPIRGDSEAFAPNGELMDSPLNGATYEIGALKNFQVLGNRRLGRPETGGCIADAAGPSTKPLNDRAAYRMREGLEPFVEQTVHHMVNYPPTGTITSTPEGDQPPDLRRNIRWVLPLLVAPPDLLVSPVADEAPPPLDFLRSNASRY